MSCDLIKVQTGDLNDKEFVFGQMLTVHVFVLLLRIEHHVFCSFCPNMLSSNVDSDVPLFPRSPQQAPFALAQTMLTEKTHLQCIVKIFINSNLCHSDRASAEKENILALYKSITQVVKKICSHAI